ncbi:WD repeat-containing protein 33 [Trapelia coarctata]|nr:WD repeat-containing protein 33 [Trapelia coarctata]
MARLWLEITNCKGIGKQNKHAKAAAAARGIPYQPDLLTDLHNYHLLNQGTTPQANAAPRYKTRRPDRARGCFIAQIEDQDLEAFPNHWFGYIRNRRLYLTTGDPPQTMALALACEARSYSIDELMAIHDKSKVSLGYVELSEECPREVFKYYAVSIAIPRVSQSSLDNDNLQPLSSSDDDSGNQGGVNIHGDDSGYQGGAPMQAIRQPLGPPELIEVQKLQGFSRFVRDHISPTHKRVTAGGRVVPAGPVTPPVTFTKPFLDEFIKVADRALQRPQPAQVYESDNNGDESHLINLQQSNQMQASTYQPPVLVHSEVRGNPFGIHNPQRLPKPDDEANNAGKGLLELPGCEVVHVNPDGTNVIRYGGSLYRGSKMGNKTRYDLICYPNGEAALGLGPCYVLEEAQLSGVPVDEASTLKAGGQTQTFNGQSALDPRLVLPQGAQFQGTLSNGTLIFLYNGKLASAKLLGGEIVYGDVLGDGYEALGLVDPRTQFQHHPVQTMEAMPASGFIAPQYSYGPVLRQVQPLAPNNPVTPGIALPSNTDNLAAYESKMQLLNKQLAQTQAELSAHDKDYALHGHDYTPDEQASYSYRRGVLVNTIASVRQAIKRVQSDHSAKVASGTGEGPSNSGLANRANQPQVKSQLSPDAPPFVPGNYGVAGPSSAVVLHEYSYAHLRTESAVTWNSDMEHNIIPSIDSVISGAVPSRKGKEKASEYSDRERQTLAPFSVYRAQGEVQEPTRGFRNLAEPESSDNEPDNGSESSVEAKDEKLWAVSHFHDSNPIAKYPHHDENGTSWLGLHFDPTPKGEKIRAGYEAERRMGYLARRGVNEEALLLHLFGEKQMATWEPFPDETPMEFFTAYFIYETGYENAKRFIMPDSPHMFPGFELPENWLDKTSNEKDGASGETPRAAEDRKAEEKQPEEIFEVAESSRSAQNRQAKIDESRRATIEENYRATTEENRRATTETSDANASQAKESVSHPRKKSSMAKQTGNELTDVTNSTLVVRERRLSRKNVSFGESSEQMVAYQTEESSDKPNEANLTPEDRQLMRRIIAEQVEKALMGIEAQAYVDKVTNAKMTDIQTRNDQIIEKNVKTAQANIDKEAHEKLAQSKKELAQKEKELAEQQKIIAEQERQLAQYQNTPPRAAPKSRQRSAQKTKPALPKYGESGYSYMQPNPEANLPRRPYWNANQQPNFDRRPANIQNQNHRFGGQQVGPQTGTPNRQHMGYQMGTPGRQQMGFQTGTPGRQPMGHTQITPPHMVPQMAPMQYTPPHMAPQTGAPPMGTMQYTPPHMVAPPHVVHQIAPHDAHFSRFGNTGLGNPMMDQPIFQPIRQPRGPPPMGTEQTMGHQHPMAPQHRMAPRQVMVPQHPMAPRQINAPQQMIGRQQINAPRQMIRPEQVRGPLNMGHQQMHPAPFNGQEARFIEHGNHSNVHGNEDSGNQLRGPPMAPPRRGPSPFETQDVRNMGQGNHEVMGRSFETQDMGQRSLEVDIDQMMGQSMGSVQAGPPNMRRYFFESQDKHITYQVDHGFGPRRNQDRGTEETDSNVGAPNDDPSLLYVEDDGVAAHQPRLRYGIDPPQTNPQINRQMNARMRAQREAQMHDERMAEMDDQMEALMQLRREAEMHGQRNARRNARMQGQMEHYANPQMHGPMNAHPMTPESTRPSGVRHRDFVGNAPMEPDYLSTSPGETPSSRRGNRRIGNDQMMSSRHSGSPEATRSSGRRAEDESGSPEDTHPVARAENRRGQGQMMAASPFDHRKVSSPYAVGFGRPSRSPEEEAPSGHNEEIVFGQDPFGDNHPSALGGGRAGNVSVSPPSVQVSSVHRGQVQYRVLGAIGSRPPPPPLGDFKFPGGHPGRPRTIEDSFNNPFHVAERKEEARAAQYGLLPNPRL